MLPHPVININLLYYYNNFLATEPQFFAALELDEL